jgi:hypothetical protein
MVGNGVWKYGYMKHICLKWLKNFEKEERSYSVDRSRELPMWLEPQSLLFPLAVLFVAATFATTTAAPPPALGAKQGQDVYLAGQKLPSSLATTGVCGVNPATTHLVNMLLCCHGPIGANADLNVVL